MAEELKLNVGDNVVVRGCFSDEIAKVERITPTGRIYVKGKYYNKHGWEIGGDTWEKAYIDYATKEEIDRILQKQAINKAHHLMRNCNIENITFEQAKKIIEILENKEK